MFRARICVVSRKETGGYIQYVTFYMVLPEFSGPCGIRQSNENAGSADTRAMHSSMAVSSTFERGYQNESIYLTKRKVESRSVNTASSTKHRKRHVGAKAEHCKPNLGELRR